MSTSYDKPTVKLTYDDYLLFPFDGNRHEIVQGRHYMNPAPSPQHQTVSRHIQFQLYQQIELSGHGQVFDAPIDLQLSDTSIVQPDLVVVLNANHIVTDTRLKGVPDLVVEILSPSNREYDRQLKKRLYEQHGVPEFWIVDPENKSVEQNLLGEDGRYRTTQCVEQIQFLRYAATVNLSTIWGKS